MDFQSHIFGVLVGAVLLASPAHVWADFIRTLDFGSDPGWSTSGNGSNGNNFGYRASSNAGGSLGEAGGRFTRSNSFRYYADTSLGGTLTLNNSVTTSGRFDYTSAQSPDFVNGLFLGYFQSSTENYAMGIYFSNGGSDASKLAWGINVRGDSYNVVSSQTTIDANIDRTWSFNWNPTGGTSGFGELTATLSGPGGGTKIVDMPSGTTLRDAAHFDAFGLMGTNVNASANSSLYADVYVDNLSYTVASVPEPSSALLALLASAAFAGYTRSSSLRQKFRERFNR